jgi:hypothetical protein
MVSVPFARTLFSYPYQDKSKEYVYEVRFAGSSGGAPEYLSRKKLEKQGWAKAIKAIDARLAQTTGLAIRPLSSSNVEVSYFVQTQRENEEKKGERGKKLWVVIEPAKRTCLTRAQRAAPALTALMFATALAVWVTHPVVCVNRGIRAAVWHRSLPRTRASAPL